ncbi:MAG: DUF1416 domain-containing protein [Gemmatimonadetes bacterium]|nr:DUF1416 domain-containing protein [Gemmatimonadota bacterium]NIQ54344.1 DUF1416 domain-containing protein [Gemmatimonadota bacterium]NIU74554.1 DUF1416 domain-containing protein [Gammaproteobacteria bacterium]NIX44489.1 DUF1416 domain-containing protein [Gemmatimonadota bacterium]NIY08719.1 DUF1416 domain-containing protein [Gemmatimonadota bacterium]
MRTVGTFVLCGLGFAAPLAGQTIRGTLAEPDGVPVQGALVVLLAPEDDSTRAGVLTDRAGRFLLRAEPGRWRVRADRIGHRSAYSEPLELSAGDDVVLELVAPVEAVPLDALAVTAAPRSCRARPEGPATARLWDDARKALENAFWAREQELVGFEAVLYQRRLDPESLRVRTEETERRAAIGRRPFSTPLPEELAARGFVQQTDSGTYYFAPDEQVLLSDVFLAGHCIQLRRSAADPGLVGLAFRPLRGHDVVDIEGVLWLDEATRELRFLEYAYTNLRLDIPTEDVGGRVQFQRLPTGAWIPRRWWIRMPVIEIVQTTRLGFDIERPTLAAIRERGGEVVAVRTRRDGRIEQLDRPRVQGIVYDSIRGRPVADAEVRLEGTDHATRTDDGGHFLLAAPEGDYRLTFRHPRLDTLGISAPTRPIGLRAGVLVQARLAIPTEETLLVQACAPVEGSVIAGSVRDGEDRPIIGAVVRLAWRPEDQPIREGEVRTDADGRFLFCEAPHGLPVYARAVHGDRTSETFPVLAAPGRPGRLALRVDTLRLGRIIGRATDAHTAQPLGGAVVRVHGTGLQTLTEDDGRFALRDVPPGRQVLELEHVAYGVRDDTLRVASGATLSVDVRATPGAIELDPLTVTAERQYRVPGLAGFYDRMERGNGVFVTAEQIELRQAGRVSEVLRAVPGLSISCGTPDALGTGCLIQFDRARVMNARGGARDCPVQWFLDGTATNQAVVESIRPQFIEGVEVYNGLSEVPPRFRRGPDTRCGVIAVWLKTGP